MSSFIQTFSDINVAYFVLQQETLRGMTKVEETRNGKALVWQEPQLFCHLRPDRRVLFDVARDANPFFHYMEAIWMLSGRNDVKFPATFASNLLNYSDDGLTMHGAYGRRWEQQLDTVVDMLRDSFSTRRVVLQMWDWTKDLGTDSKDLPCNTHIYFRVQNDALDMTVMNRSNDLVWGMLGANYVHFTVLQEWIAGAIGVPMGKYYHFTNNLHVYAGWEGKVDRAHNTWYPDHPAYDRIPFSPDTLNRQEAADFVRFPEQAYDSPILVNNAKPMWWAWEDYKAGNFASARGQAGRIYDQDWREACLKWLIRREVQRESQP